MSKKTLPTEGIINELQGASSYFFPQSSNLSPTDTVLPQTETQNNKAEVSSSAIQTISQPFEDNPVRSDDHLPSSDMENASDQTNTPQKQITRMLNNKNEPIIERTNERTFGRKNERLIKRVKVRHTFDIFADQLLSLKEISIEQEKFTGERVLLGDLAQQAFDIFISKQRKK